MCFGGELPELGSDSAVSPIATLCPHGPFVATDSCLRDTVPWFCTKSICVHPQSTDIMKTWESSPCALPQAPGLCPSAVLSGATIGASQGQAIDLRDSTMSVNRRHS